MKINVYEAEGTERTWLHDLLDDNRIPFEVVVEPYWTGIKISQFHEKQLFYVDEIYVTEVKRLIGDYNNSSNFVTEEPNLKIDEDGMPQITCVSCGKEVDFDYPKCPYCGKTVEL